MVHEESQAQVREDAVGGGMKKFKRVVLFVGRHRGPVRDYDGGTLAYIQTREWRCVVPYKAGIGKKKVRLVAEVLE